MNALRMLASRSSLALLAFATAGYAGYSMYQSRKLRLPSPGANKQDPAKLDKMLDTALADSMATSDPASTVMPEVRN